MLRMWVKFEEKDGRKIIDRASFQSFGCQTAIAVASLATEMLKGKTIDEAKNLSASELAAPLGALPPMKIHCGQMVEGALRSALEDDNKPEAEANADAETAGVPADRGTLASAIAPAKKGTVRLIKLDEEN